MLARGIEGVLDVPDLTPLQDEVVEGVARQIRAPTAAWPLNAWMDLWKGKERAAKPTKASRNGGSYNDGSRNGGSRNGH